MREPYKRDKFDKTMNLPEGTTCGDCGQIKRCADLCGQIPADEVCDWYPIRFYRPAAQVRSNIDEDLKCYINGLATIKIGEVLTEEKLEVLSKSLYRALSAAVPTVGLASVTQDKADPSMLHVNLVLNREPEIVNIEVKV